MRAQDSVQVRLEAACPQAVGSAVFGSHELCGDTPAPAMTASRSRASFFNLVLATLCMGSVQPTALAQTAGLDAALNVAALRGARVAALAVRASDGATLYARQPDELLAPASNQKILTAIAALVAYGPAHRFTTTVSSESPPDANGRVGNLYVRGGGDPALTSEEWWRLSADLRRRGLRRIDGDILVDDSAFDGERRNPAWGAASARAYFPAVGALMANYGSFTAEVAPGDNVGDRLRVAVDPPIAYLILDNSGKTTARGGSSVVVDREGSSGAERVVVSGNLPLDAAPLAIYRSVAEPALYAGALLRMQLSANDIAVGGSVRRAPTPATAHTLLAYQGKSLTEILRLLLKYSNNGIAEALCKGLGAAGTGQGSWDAGLSATRAHLRSVGIDVSALTLVDGSGLAASNRVSPRAFVTALRVARASFAFGPEFVAALPIAGLDGTLQQRAGKARARVRAKTGLLAGAVGLSGYAELADGEEAIFSVLVNGYDGGDAEVMAAIDGFVTTLVGSTAASKHTDAQ
jgi:serine-type D-Ala-D-Ala carboxypeptidase/endopeptidase (penicillin-binding protein 4)